MPGSGRYFSVSFVCFSATNTRAVCGVSRACQCSLQLDLRDAGCAPARRGAGLPQLAQDRDGGVHAPVRSLVRYLRLALQSFEDGFRNDGTDANVRLFSHTGDVRCQNQVMSLAEEFAGVPGQRFCIEHIQSGASEMA